jgi:drug/metabolite transporter (DMT)-like permease
LGILTIQEDFSLNKGDLLVLISAIAFAFHIIYTGTFVRKIEPIGFTIVQLFVGGIITSVRLPKGILIWSSILFTALLATAFMFTIQSLAQQYIGEEKISILFLLEPVLPAWLA